LTEECIINSDIQIKVLEMLGLPCNFYNLPQMNKKYKDQEIKNKNLLDHLEDIDQKFILEEGSIYSSNSLLQTKSSFKKVLFENSVQQILLQNEKLSHRIDTVRLSQL
jgi:hypothetical protein